MILAIDPGPERSAWVAQGNGCIDFDTILNEHLLEMLRALTKTYFGRRSDGEMFRVSGVVIEKVESFGMPVGAEVFETVFWAGRFAEAAYPIQVERIGRKAVKLWLCGDTRAKDPNVRQALIDRYGGKDIAIGRKAAPGPLYGLTGDCWSALAVAVAWSEGAR